jgi:hypothetical protein
VRLSPREQNQRGVQGKPLAAELGPSVLLSNCRPGASPPPTTSATLSSSPRPTPNITGTIIETDAWPKGGVRGRYVFKP